MPHNLPFEQRIWSELEQSARHFLICLLCETRTRDRGVYMPGETDVLAEPLAGTITRISEGKQRALIYPLCVAHPKDDEATREQVDAVLLAKQA